MLRRSFPQTPPHLESPLMARENLESLIAETRARMKTIRDSL
jgi:hypothetical protein